ncbi:MAG: hydantoinase/oxoprolinase family protein [Rhizobiaceae bacterium]
MKFDMVRNKMNENHLEKKNIIGVDVGGTFTDVIGYDLQEKTFTFAKVPSTPGKQWEGVLGSIDILKVNPDEIIRFAHGTTVATNVLLEGAGAHCGLVTTKGFRDALEIGKTKRLVGGLFDMKFVRNEPLVGRTHRYEVDERMGADGVPLVGVDPDAVRALALTLKEKGYEAVAVCLINSHVNPKHEEEIAEILESVLGDVPVSVSSRLVRERGEFERMSTAAVNAYLTPGMVSYLDRVDNALTDRGIEASVDIMGSNGGAMSLERARGFSVGTFLSGPVGGVTASVKLCDLIGIRNIITFDMGGTSTDVLLARDLEPRMSFDNRLHSYPLRVPQFDIHTIGAGGGSLIYLNNDKTIAVGPRSAGAFPGPACYGRGGELPTVSDANLILGRLSTRRPIAGELKLSRERSVRAFEKIIAEMGGDTSQITDLASAAFDISIAKMSGAVREVSVYRGFDPRDFALVAFGGAGAMHALFVADELGINTVVVPLFPGHFSALGQIMAEYRRDFVLPWNGRISEQTIEDARDIADQLMRMGNDYLGSESVPQDFRSMSFSVDARYAGQSFTLPVDWNPWKDDFGELRAKFARRHEETFGYADEDNDVEVTAMRISARGSDEGSRDLDLVDIGKSRSEDDSDMLLENRQVWFGDAWHDCPVYFRNKLPSGPHISGPAVIEEFGGTTVVPPGWEIEVHLSGALLCQSKRTESRNKLAA